MFSGLKSSFEEYDVLLKLAPRYWAVQDHFDYRWRKYLHTDKPKVTDKCYNAGFRDCAGPFYSEDEIEKFIKEINK